MTIFCVNFGSGFTMASTIGFNSILVSRLQEDEDLSLTFEEASWICNVYILIFNNLILNSVPHVVVPSAHIFALQFFL